MMSFTEFIKEKKGFEDQWPEYKPHISLSYAKDSLPDIKKVKLPEFEISYETWKVTNAAKL